MVKTVYIRPIAEGELELLALLFQEPDEASEYGFFGYGDPGRLRRDFAENGFFTDQGGRLAVAVGSARESSEFVGEVGWHRVTTGPNSSSWNIGIGLLATARGQGYGTRAQRLLAEYLFAHGIPAYPYSTEIPVAVLGAKYKWARGAGLI